MGGVPDAGPGVRARGCGISVLRNLLIKLNELFAPNQRYGVRVGRVFGVEIWWHWWLVAIVALQLLFFLLRSESYPYPLAHWAIYLLTLPSSLLFHELLHAFTAHRLGGRAERLVLSPIGGMVPCEAPPEPRVHLLVAASGPVANGLLLVVSGGVCLVLGWPLLPVAEPLFHRLFFQSLFLWNAFLLLLNALPCYPMDAGRILLMALWSRRGSYQDACLLTLKLSRITAVAAMITGVALLFVALGNESFPLEHPLANHLMVGLLLVGFLHFYEARRLELQLLYARDEEADEKDEEEEGIFGYDFSQGYTSLERTSPGPGEETSHGPPQRVRRRERVRRRQEARRQEDRELRERVDDLLAKIHQSGLGSLSDEEQEFLERASRRFGPSVAPRDPQRG